jgi:hypothetical protein
MRFDRGQMLKYRTSKKDPNDVMIVSEATQSKVIIREQTEHCEETRTGIMLIIPRGMELHDQGDGIHYIVSPMDDEDLQRMMGFIVDEQVQANVDEANSTANIMAEEYVY